MSTDKLHDDEKPSLLDMQSLPQSSQSILLVPEAITAASHPLDPHRWPTWRKWLNVFLVASQATLAPFCSTLIAVGATEIDKEFHVTSPVVSALPVALFIVGLGLGPLYLAPLSEMYGRRIVYIVSFGLFSLFNVGCALVHDQAGFIVLRFLAGLAGRSLISLIDERMSLILWFSRCSAGPSLGGSTIGDLFTREERGGAQAVYGFGSTFGPAIGGLIGGYIAQHVGWRWLLWIMAIS